MTATSRADLAPIWQSLAARGDLAVNLYTDSAAMTATLTEQVRAAAPYLVELDTAAYASFADLLRDLLSGLLAHPDKPENCRLPEDVLATADPDDLRRYTSRLLSTYSRGECWFCLLLTHFDAAPAYWDDEPFSWMRELIDLCRIPACVVLSERPLSDITDKPIGSSPFHNVFAVRAAGEEGHHE